MSRIVSTGFLGSLSTLFLSLASCHKPDDVKSTIGCGCEGNFALTLNDTLARLTPAGILYIKGSEKAVYRGIMPCDFSKISGLLPSAVDTSFIYKVSGGLRPPCITNGTVYVWSIDLIAIRRVK